MASKKNVLIFVNHSAKVQSIASKYGWLPGARYTNLRDVKHFKPLGFLDINWKKYDFHKHLEAATISHPLITVARDVTDIEMLPTILDQAYQLLRYSKYVVIVPKDPKLSSELDKIPSEFLLGYSVPTRYGSTTIPPTQSKRPVHLLGGRPDVQRQLASQMPVFSIDANRFTLDASFGDYFDGEIFRPHPVGGYEQCIRDSVQNISALWDNYHMEGI